MGEVHRARDSKLGREVAIKVLPEAFAKDAERVARFEREARLLAALNHPRIASIYGFDHTDGAHFLVLELAPGESLASRLARGPLPVAEAVQVARQVADGLEAAHDKGIVHRDLKPGNIQVSADGQVKLLDFGLAKAFAPDPTAPDSSQSPTVTSGGTRYGVILGTAAYMSPEQARGQELDRRTDVWVFGCVLYECLAGTRAFPGLTVSDTIVAVLEREPDWNALPARTPPSVRRLLRRCLRKDPRSRQRDIGDARLELEDDSAEAPASAPGARRSPLPPLAAGLAVLALVAAAAFVLGSRDRGDVTHEQPRLKRLTWDGGIATDPALSPDGSMVVYASNRGDESNLDLWLQRVAGIVQLVRAAAAEYGRRGVRVNALGPGVVDTPLTAPIKANPGWYGAYAQESILNRWASPDEMAWPHGLPAERRRQLRDRHRSFRRRRLDGPGRPLHPARDVRRGVTVRRGFRPRAAALDRGGPGSPRPQLARKVASSASSCSKVSPRAPVLPEAMASSRACFDG